jgi:hypothetical protein
LLVRSCGPKPVKSTVFPREITAGPEVTAKRHASPDLDVAARVSGAIDAGEGARNVIDCGVEPAGAATLSFRFPGTRFS